MANLPEDFAFIGYQLAIKAEKNERIDGGGEYKKYKKIGILILTRAIQQKLLRSK